MLRLKTFTAGALLLAGAAMGVRGAAPGAQAPGGTRERAYRENNLGVARLEQFDYEAAAAAFRAALAADSSLALPRLNLAIALFYAGNAEAAATEASAAVAAMPRSPSAHYVLGLIARSRNQAQQAAAEFEQVQALDPADVGSAINLGQIYLQERAYDRAEAGFRAALAGEPYNATAAYGLATVLMRAGKTAEGQQAMQRFQVLRDSAFATTYAQTYLQQGRYGEALASTGLEPDLVDPAVPDVRYADVTNAILGADPVSAGFFTAADLDGDGDLDLVVGDQSRLQVLRNDDGRFRPGVSLPLTGMRPGAVVSGDFDNDGRRDLFVTGSPSGRLYHQQPDGGFVDVTARAGLPAADGTPATAVALADFDHDGDLDILIGAPLRFLRNNGNGTFSDATSGAHLGAGLAAVAVAATDYDDRRDMDLLAVGRGRAPALFRNLRDGTFRDVAADLGLPAAAEYSALAVGDVNKDSLPDFFFGRTDAAGVLAISGPSGKFTVTPAPDGGAGAVAAAFVDYDNDGALDLLVLTVTGPKLWRHVGERWAEVTSRALAEIAKAGAAGSLVAGDFDGDGDEDLVVRSDAGPAPRLAVWRNEGGNRNRSLAVRLAARVSNRSAVGSKVEIRAGSLRQKLETSVGSPAAAPVDLLFGLGQRASADVVRILWPAGILQAEIDPVSPAVVTELDRKPSSCPFLYVWNGSSFEFVTDFMGGGEMGYLEAPGKWNTPDPDEYVRIGDRLRAKDGRYELRVTNELEEALFVDRLQLVAVDHPAGVEVFPDEGLKPAPPPFSIVTTRGAKPPVAAADDHGHDVLPRLTSLDRTYPDDFALLPIRGYAASHALTLDLGPDADRAVLLLTGWTDYAFSSDNVAASQSGLSLEPPSLQALSPSGEWRTVVSDIGIPIGRPQTVVVDVRGKLPAGSRQVRILTNMRIYWDRILVDASGGGIPTRVTRRDAASAQLRWRGFSAEVTPDGREPFGYDYARVGPVSPWKALAGRYTREGDVRELLRRTDDMFVIAMPGDEIALSFDDSAFPALAPGWARTFLLYADGFSKEMDISSAAPDVLEPLPFHGMTRYPYGSGERYPETAAHRAYQDRYNTRVVSRGVPSVDTALGAKPLPGSPPR